MREPLSGHCLYTVLHAPRERLEPLLLDHVAPILHAVRDDPALESLFFVRYSEPRWQLRVRVLGERAWVEGPVRARFEACVNALTRSGAIEGHAFAQYDREWERYGGREGMALAERLFTLDSLAALDLLEAERSGGLARSRREWSVALVDRMLTAAGLEPDERAAFYRRGWEWALGPEGWDADDLAVLERRFEALRPGLERLLLGPGPAPEALWGGAAPAAIAERFLAAAGPVLREVRAGCAAGRIRQVPTYLYWSYAHMLTNRLGIESTAEAILRYLVHRLLEPRPSAAS